MAPATARTEDVFPGPALRSAPTATVLDFSGGGSSRIGTNPSQRSRDKTNPAPGRHAKGGRDLLLASLA
jgi:hypothetical protein